MPNRTVAASSAVLDHWRALTVPHTAATFAPAPHQWEYIRQRLTNPHGGYVLNICSTPRALNIAVLLALSILWYSSRPQYCSTPRALNIAVLLASSILQYLWRPQYCSTPRVFNIAVLLAPSIFIYIYRVRAVLTPIL
jgi:hypothetical protein